MDEEDKALLKQYRSQCRKDKIKRYGVLLIAAIPPAASILFDLSAIWVLISFISIILALVIALRLYK